MASASSAPLTGIVKCAAGLDGDLGSEVKAFLPQRSSAALYSLKPGDAHFLLEAIFTKAGETRVLTAFFGGPWTAELMPNWKAIRDQNLVWDDMQAFGRALEAHIGPRDDVHAYFLVFWRGEDLPPVEPPIAFTDDIPSTTALTADRLRQLVRNTFLPSDYWLKTLCGSAGSGGNIPGLSGFALYYIGHIAGQKVESNIGEKFKA